MVDEPETRAWPPLAARSPRVSRVLEPDGQVALIWNSRRKSSTPFLEEYERLIVRFGTDYTAVDHTRLKVREKLDPFFGHERFAEDGRVKIAYATRVFGAFDFARACVCADKKRLLLKCN